ncbi:SCO2322 family protein [Streptomyces sp. NBC_00847]|uniref:SCO2322 family protein n=1 Tax=Streptomyces sp. NBC_00847 TaxID=2975850 RepID=UPI0022577262|nr:SCO2322 family protein [Streptomyces sp. NBC_00847]MCX4880473.1 SCO2322 family protein [Streptomyces sp. NBC_00847]
MIRRCALLLTALLLTLAGGGQAQAVGYRYWSFWDHDAGHWTYATQGPATTSPDDGAVQGFRFSVSEDSGDSAKPRGTASFPVICARTPARDGMKRVALVIDFGTAADAPSGETPPVRRTACARVSSDGTTAEALASVAKPLRYDTNALLCAIAGYPHKGCGEQASGGKKPTAAASSAKSGEKEGGPAVGLFVGAGAVALLGAAAVWQTRRRRHG